MTDIVTVDIADLVSRARSGDQDGWADLVHHLQPIIDAAGRRYRLGHEDAADLSQTVWLQLTCHLAGIRDPRALPGWIKITAEREAYRLIRIGRRTTSLEPIVNFYEGRSSPAELRYASTVEDLDADLLRTETRTAVQAGLATLKPNQRDLLMMLVAEPAIPYAEISSELGLPVGSIGPTRARCLRKLQATASVRALTDAGRPVALAA